MSHVPGHPELQPGEILLGNPITTATGDYWSTDKTERELARAAYLKKYPALVNVAAEDIPKYVREVKGTGAQAGKIFWHIKPPGAADGGARDELAQFDLDERTLHSDPDRLREHYEAKGMVFDKTDTGVSRQARPTTHAVYWNERTQNYQIRSLTAEDPEDWDLFQDGDGNLVFYDKNSAKTQTLPPNLKSLNSRPDVTKADIKLLKTVELGDQTRIEFYQVGNKIEQYKVDPRKAAPAVDPSQNQVNVPGYGTFFNVGPNQFDFIPLKDDPFVPNNAINVPELNGTMIQTSPNQWQFVRDSYEPGVKIDQRTGVRFVQDANGTWREMASQTDPGVVQIGDREFLQQRTGDWSELDRQFDPGVIRDPSGLTLIQQPTGAVTQARAANMNELIAQALVDGDTERAFAFADFRDRPTATESMETALAYARSPADQQIISSLARGETPVREPDAGVIQRVGPRPDFLVQAYQDFQRRTQAGRAPTEEEAQQLTERAATGQTPQTDDLRMRLEKATMENEIAREKHQMTMEQQSEAHQMKMEVQRQKMQNDMEAFQQKMAVANGGGASSRGGATTAGGTSGRQFQLNSAQLKRLEEQNLASGFHGSPEETRAYSQHLINIGKAEWYEGYDKPGYMTRGEEIDPGDTRVGGEDWGAALKYQMEEMLAGQIDDIPLWAGADEMNKQIENYRDQGGDMRDVGIHLKQIHDEKARMKVQEKRDREQKEREDLIESTQTIDTDPIGTGTTGLLGATQPTGTTTDFTSGLQSRSRFGADPTPAVDQSISELRGRSRFGGSGRSTDYDRGIQFVDEFAGGGMTRGNNLELVGEEGPELVDLPAGSFVLPLKQLNHKQMLDLKRKGVRGYQSGGIVFDDNQTQSATLPFGLRQMQAGRPITPSRGYLSQQAGLRLPSAQAFQNITPESREVFLDLAAQAGIPRKSFAQELALTVPSGRRLPVARIAPVQRRAIQ